MGVVFTSALTHGVVGGRNTSAEERREGTRGNPGEHGERPANTVGPIYGDFPPKVQARPHLLRGGARCSVPSINVRQDLDHREAGAGPSIAKRFAGLTLLYYIESLAPAVSVSKRGVADRAVSVECPF